MSRHHHIHILLSLTLFLLFVLGSFFVVAYEIKGYQKLNEQCLLEDDLNIPLAYLNTKLKAMDEKGAISVVSIQGRKCLKMVTTKTATYIYYLNGYLKELYTDLDYLPSLDEGTNLFILDDFQIDRQENLYTFIVKKEQYQKRLFTCLEEGVYERKKSIFFVYDGIDYCYFLFCIVNNCMYFIFSQSKRKTNGWSYDSKCYVRNAKYD